MWRYMYLFEALCTKIYQYLCIKTSLQKFWEMIIIKPMDCFLFFFVTDHKTTCC